MDLKTCQKLRDLVASYELTKSASPEEIIDIKWTHQYGVKNLDERIAGNKNIIARIDAKILRREGLNGGYTMKRQRPDPEWYIAQIAKWIAIAVEIASIIAIIEIWEKHESILYLLFMLSVMIIVPIVTYHSFKHRW
jgi:uncharacterized small protein (DUF1192 family)